jgi:hypothetical protein
MMEWATEVERDEYGLVHDVCDADQVGAILSGLENVNIARSRAGIRHVMSQSAVANVARSTQMMTIARSVLGSTAVPFRATLFDKSPESNWLVAWHQDTALPLQKKREVEGWGPWSTKEASFTLTLLRKLWRR